MNEPRIDSEGEATARMPYHYRLFGLTMASELEIPELPPVDSGDIDVKVLLGRVEPVTEGKRVGGLRMRGDVGVVEGPGMRYAVECGERITVDVESGTSLRNVRLFLLGSAIGALLHQRAMLPLHANAIDLNGRAIAFAGKSGAGKSTLAAAFHDHGYQILCDDVCVVTRNPEGRFEAQPGIPRVRLWRDAVERSGRSAELLDLAYDGVDKFVVPIGEGYAQSAVPLEAIFILGEQDPERDALEIRRPHPARGAQLLIANTYRGRYVPLLGDQRRHFEQCLELSARVPVFELDRPWDAARIGETVTQIEAHLDAIRKA